MKKFIIALIWISFFGAQAQQVEKAFEATFTITQKMDFLLYVPETYSQNPTKAYPLMIFLHGSGERGDTLELVKVHGPPKLAERDGWEFIVVSPQCKLGTRWSDEVNMQTLSRLLDLILEEYRVDEDRVYLTGLSMGGSGSWAWAAREPERFAAVVPICGAGDPGWAKNYKGLPIWVFHGAKDRVVPLVRSEEMVQAIKPYNPDIKLTVYPEAGHDSWTETYDNPVLYEWMLSHKRE